MREKQLTISVAAFQAEATLEAALRSLVLPEEKREQLEVIVVDDGSSDGTAAISQRYVDRYPECFRLYRKENGGYGSTLTAALSLAEGTYFKVVDADDRVDPAALAALLSVLEREPADLVLTPFFLWPEGTEELKKVDRHPELADVPLRLEEAALGDGLAIFELCMKTDVLRRGHPRFTEHCFYTDNELVMAALLYAETTVACKQAVSCYRIGRNGQSMSVRGLAAHYRDTMTVSEVIFAMYEGAGVLHGMRREQAEKLITSLVRLTYRAVMVQEEPLAFRPLLEEYDRTLRARGGDLYALSLRSRLVRQARGAGALRFRLLSRLLKEREKRRKPW